MLVDVFNHCLKVLRGAHGAGDNINLLKKEMLSGIDGHLPRVPP